jgi:hypothetical protein
VEDDDDGLSTAIIMVMTTRSKLKGDLGTIKKI